MPPSSCEIAAEAFVMKAMSAALTMDQLRNQAADVIHVIEPGDEVLAGEFIAAREVAVYGSDGTLRQLAEGRRIQISPIP